MKKIFTSLFIASAFLLVGNVATSCSKVEDLVDEISVPIPFAVPVSLDVEVPFATANTTHYVTYPELPLNLDLDARIKEKYPSLSINNLKSVKVESFNIQYVSSDSGVNLDAVKNARIYIKAPNLDRQLIGTVSNNTNGAVLNFVPDANTELLDYLKSSQNSLILEVQGSKVAADLMKLKINASFKLEVGL